MLTVRQLARAILPPVDAGALVRAILPPLIIATVMPLAVGILWAFINFKMLGLQGMTENAGRLRSAGHLISRTEGILSLAMVVWAGWRGARQPDGMLTAALSGAIVFAAIHCEELAASMYVHKTHLASDLVLGVVVQLLFAGIFGGILGAVGGFLSARRRSVVSRVRT
jgi:hypothetical protein